MEYNSITCITHEAVISYKLYNVNLAVMSFKLSNV